MTSYAYAYTATDDTLLVYIAHMHGLKLEIRQNKFMFTSLEPEMYKQCHDVRITYTKGHDN